MSGMKAFSGVPKYVLLREEIRQMIDGGALKPGELIESESSLVTTRKLSKATVRKALLDLVRDGLLERKQGVGTVVLPPRTISGQSVGFVYDSEHLGNHDIFLSHILLGFGEFLMLNSNSLVIRGVETSEDTGQFFSDHSRFVFYEDVSNAQRRALEHLRKPYVVFNSRRPVNLSSSDVGVAVDFDNEAMGGLLTSYVEKHGKPNRVTFIFPSKHHLSFDERFAAVQSVCGRFGIGLGSWRFEDSETEVYARTLLADGTDLLCFGNDHTGHLFYRSLRKSHPESHMTNDELFFLSGLPALGFDGTDVYCFGHQLAGTVAVDLFAAGRYLAQVVLSTDTASRQERISVDPILY